jgi:hypothetical protein
LLGIDSKFFLYIIKPIYQRSRNKELQ